MKLGKLKPVLYGALLHWFAISCYCYADVTSVADENNAFEVVRPFSAVLVEYNKHNISRKLKTRITLSNYGMRSETLTYENEADHVVFIQDYQASKKWIVSPDRHSYCELPGGSARKEGDQTGSLPKATDHDFLMREPCSGSHAEKISTRKIKTTELTVWKCSDEEGRVVLEHHSSLLGLVIRTETQSGDIKELQEISITPQPEEYFKPSEKWREVSMEEFFTGNVVLQGYKE